MVAVVVVGGGGGGGVVVVNLKNNGYCSSVNNITVFLPSVGCGLRTSPGATYEFSAG